MVIYLATTLLIAVFAAILFLRQRDLRRAEYVRTYMFPPGLLDRFAVRRPGLELKDRQLVARALRQFFLAYLKSGRKFVSMPSQVVDDLWHEFILYTKHYDVFCRRAFGRFMHHSPAVVLGANRRLNDGLRRVWWYSCVEENIDPQHAMRLPLLFAIDSKLNAADGFRYVVDCTGVSRQRDTGGSAIYCGGHMSDSSMDGAAGDDSGDTASTDSGDGGGCGGGD